MFAIIKTGGKQYRVAEQDLITVDKISGQPGDAVQFGEVLLLGGENVVVGSPMVSGATVAGEMVKQGRGEKVIAFKKRRRKNSRRKRGHRQEFSVIRITEILTEGRKPTAKAETARQAEAAPRAAREAVAPAPQPAPAAPAAAQPAPPAQAKPTAPTKKAEAKPPAPAAKAEGEAEKPEGKPAKPKAAAKPAKKPAAKPKAEKPAATPAKKPAAKKPAADKGKGKKK